MASWEEKFRRWAQPPSDAEEARCENTIKAIREAIQRSPELSKRDVRAFVQGSYRNNTNVRRDSDVDVGVVCYDVLYSDLPEDVTDEDVGLTSTEYTYATFKRELGKALTAFFDAGTVTRGNKAFDIKASRVQVEADVAPFFEHRRYGKNLGYWSGVELRPDDGNPSRVINWPEQHHENGVRKNNDTGRRYKSLVRVFKSLRNEMEDSGIDSAKPIIGFLNECLLWNAPNHLMGGSTLTSDVRGCLSYLIDKTSTDIDCKEWGEVSELKYLFRAGQKWTRNEANTFLLNAWQYLGMR